ncbi:hypothetical protein GCM10009790_21970 [Georgenia ruanii]
MITEDVATVETDRSLLRAAGRAAVAAALFYLLQPVAVLFLIPGATESGHYDAPGDLQRWTGPYEVVTFGGIAVCSLVLVAALARLLPRGSLAASVGTASGVVGVAGWLGIAGISLSSVSLIGRSLADIDVSLDVQREAMQAIATVGGASVGVAAFGAAGWAVAVGLSILRTGALGRRTGWIAVAGGVLVVAAALVLVHPLLGALVLIPFYLVLGVALLVTARHA